MSNIAERIEALPAVERKILEMLVGRLEKGLDRYGPWNINDERQYGQELLEEILDGLIYDTVLLLKGSPHDG